MNLKDILELEEFKDTLIASGLRWWITEHLGRKIEDVMWWNVREHPPLIGDIGHIELSAHFKDGTPFVQMFSKEELREKARAAQLEEKIGEIGKHRTREIIREAMEKAKIRDEDVIHIDGLDQETKELLLYFIESLTIKDASDILQRDYPCSVWDELHFIREKLRTSIAQPRRKR